VACEVTHTVALKVCGCYLGGRTISSPKLLSLFLFLFHSHMLVTSIFFIHCSPTNSIFSTFSTFTYLLPKNPTYQILLLTTYPLSLSSLHTQKKKRYLPIYIKKKEKSDFFFYILDHFVISWFMLDVLREDHRENITPMNIISPTHI